MEQKIQLHELCKECLLHGKNIHHCPFCTVDFNNNSDIIRRMRIIRNNFKPAFANIVMRVNKNNVELFRMKECFYTCGNKTAGPRPRKWYWDEIIEAYRKKNLNDPKATIDNMRSSRKKSIKRALDSFLSYGQNNDWRYFLTITFDPKKVNSADQSQVKYAWKKFRQKLQYYFPEIKILSVVEYHEDNEKLHFHGAIGNVDLSRVLVRAINNQPYKKNKQGEIIYRNGKPVKNQYYLDPLKTTLEDIIYNFRSNMYDLGFCSIIPLTPRDNLTTFDKIIFYLAKYMNKDKSAVPYCGKSYFHTHNLDKGTKKVFHLSDEDLDKLLLELEDLKEKKNNDKFASYVTPNTDSILEKMKAYYDIPSVKLKPGIRKIIDEIKSEETIEELDPIFLD